ncbi:Stage V sporulation protein AC [[Clostridium] ultunense Esp]|uniref:Mechanosensitive channel stage V sporulation protein AC n=1 Tax=[Clostridium] ultunense Esp TaxID=1288971 RepID=M1Z4T2_9FIRM|nr:stage V sporulation protein AC [Schnuerera ultunensis]CCQ92553.1 Stage V sporulation protein AC [[Clostridium] ultunense Esp]SHD77324.1 mechanosensitive channel; stage V sporulation protein AC [[Clostridium] ultunense Esp]
MDKMTNKEYQKYAEKKIPKPTYFKNILYAFIVGGLICVLGQILRNILFKYGLDEKTVTSATSILLVFLGSFLTGLGFYDKLGKIGGAGAAIPITGFANSIVSPAMEFKREGFIFGVAARMFSIAGPVLVYGVSSSIIVGILYLLLSKGR